MNSCEAGLYNRASNKFITEIGTCSILQMPAPLNRFFVLAPREDNAELATCSFFCTLEAALEYANSLQKPEREAWWQK